MVRERSNELPGFRERSGIKITSEKRAQYGRGRVRSGGREKGLEHVCSREGTRGHDVRRGEEGAFPGEGRGPRRPSSQEGNRPRACEPRAPSWQREPPTGPAAWDREQSVGREAVTAADTGSSLGAWPRGTAGVAVGGARREKADSPFFRE